MKHGFSLCLTAFILLLLMPLATTPAHAGLIPEPIPQDVTIADDAYHPTPLPRTEWWYFDASLSQNYSIQTNVRLTTTLLHGTVSLRLELYKDGIQLAESHTRALLSHLTASTTTCDVKLDGRQLILGTYNTTRDAYDYTVTIGQPGLNATLHYTGRTKGWKIVRAHNDSWAVMCPRADVTATIDYRGITLNLTGQGYHDHNWGIGPKKVIPYGWYWGKLNSDHYTLTWSALLSTRATNTKIAVINTLDGGYTYYHQNEVWLKPQAYTWDHGHHIPTSFFISIQNPLQMHVFHCNAKTIHYQNYLGFINYWRYHLHNTGSFTFGIQTELVDEVTIGEFTQFR
jgi:predicted secreted hydrolase